MTAIAIRFLDRDRKVIKQDYYMSNADHMAPSSDSVAYRKLVPKRRNSASGKKTPAITNNQVRVVKVGSHLKTKEET